MVDAAVYRGRAVRHRQLPVRQRRRSPRSAVGERCSPRSGTDRERACSRRSSCSATSPSSLGFLCSCSTPSTCTSSWRPINVSAKRLPDALGPLLPVESGGKPIDFEDPGEDDTFGRGKIERLHVEGHARLRHVHRVRPLPVPVPGLEHREAVVAQAGHHGPARQPVRAARRTSSGHEHGEASPLRLVADGGVIDPDVLWSCTTCGACVEQCPVDIEHVDHIVDMRRYQVMIESEFPTELGALFREPGEPRATPGARTTTSAWTGPRTSTSRSR